jgi:hypothetical protein
MAKLPTGRSYIVGDCAMPKAPPPTVAFKTNNPKPFNPGSSTQPKAPAAPSTLNLPPPPPSKND